MYADRLFRVGNLLSLIEDNKNTLKLLYFPISNLEDAKEVLSLCISKSNLKILFIVTRLNNFKYTIKKVSKRSYML